ncbi:MAG: NUDIX domain-containing protein [Desulfobacterales bacterium]|nr:MAG: NUDIX domain-containing protein [Desulfobacterales bacterium]
MAKMSAGLVMYRYRDAKLEVFLVHPGGPFWSKKDEGVWSIPKGEYTEDEEAFEVAKREFKEETGYEAEGNFIQLSPIKQPSRKIIAAWAFAGDCDAGKIKSNKFSMEWPPHSGKQAEFPEVDRAEWFPINAAKIKLLKGQVGFIEQLCEVLGNDPHSE